MGDKLKLYRCANLLMACYAGLIDAELDNDDVLYDRYLEKIKKHRKEQDKLLKDPKIVDMLDTAFLMIEEEFKMLQNFVIPFDLMYFEDKQAMIHTFMQEKLAGLRSEIEIDLKRMSFGSAFRRDFRKNTLLCIKEMRDKASTFELKERLTEIYYYFIFICPELEQEFITNPSLLNMQSTHLLRYKKAHPKIAEEDIINHNLECLRATVNRLMTGFKEASFNYEDYASLVILESSILSLLKSLPISEVLEFKAYFEAEMKEEGTELNEFAVGIVRKLINQRIKSNGTSKVVSLYG